jgi:two-component system chemotaxis response regulator CheB
MSTFRPPPRPRVLVVDDSAIARDLISRGLGLDPGIDIVGQASDVYDARDKIVGLKPNVVTLDVEMPRMDGIEFLRRLMPQYPLPVVVVSAFTAEGSRRAFEALEAGAVDVVGKPSGCDPNGLKDMLLDLATKVKSASAIDPRKIAMAPLPLALSRSSMKAANPSPRAAAAPDAQVAANRTRMGGAAATAAAAKAAAGQAGRGRNAGSRAAGAGRAGHGVAVAGQARPVGKVAGEPRASAYGCIIAIGASTGGVSAVTEIVSALPADSPPVLIVQHMPPVFTRLFAQSLAKVSAMEVKEAASGDRLRRGLVLIGQGDYHLRLKPDSGGFVVSCEEGEKISGHRPSVDALFASVAERAQGKAVGLLLTGMGRDGADGLLAMRNSGARCFAQDEASSVVFGMPQEAWRLGAVERFLSLEKAAAELSLSARTLSRDEEARWR